jgi:AraC-like DNA-binding protein
MLLERHYLKLRWPKEYAALLYITPHHLNAICREFLGVSTGEAIRNRIILEAKRLLVNIDLSISEVSYQLNFNDNSYFTKLFKKQVGSTPEEFRRKVLNKH